MAGGLVFVDEMGSHTSLWPPCVRLLASRQASLLQDTEKQRQEHHPLSEHQLRRRYGSFDGYLEGPTTREVFEASTGSTL
jgi:hypothetical protein